MNYQIITRVSEKQSLECSILNSSLIVLNAKCTITFFPESIFCDFFQHYISNNRVILKVSLIIRRINLV